MRVEDLKSLATLLGSHTMLESGGNLLVQCPFAPWTHKSGKDTRPSMSWLISNTSSSKFNCFGCGKHGVDMEVMVLQLADLGMRREVVDEALRFIEKASLALTALSVDFEEAKRPEEVVRLALPPPSFVHVVSDADFKKEFEGLPKDFPYVKRRGIREDTAELFEMRLDRKRDRLVFPVRWHHKGEIVGAVGRYYGDLPTDLPYYNYWKFHKAYVLFGEHLLTRDPVIVTEGPFDAIKVRQAGFNSVSVLGAKFSDYQVDKLVEWDQPVVIFFDPDDTGIKQGKKLARVLKKRGVPHTLTFPPDGSDAGSLSSVTIRSILTPLVQPIAVSERDYWR